MTKETKNEIIRILESCMGTISYMRNTFIKNGSGTGLNTIAAAQALVDKLDQSIIKSVKTLSEIKDQVAQENGYDNWGELVNYPGTVSDSFADEAARRYAQAYAEADRKDCAEKVKTCWTELDEDHDPIIKVDKSSILDRPYPDMK